MSAMDDFAQLPTQRKVLVFVVIGGLLGALYFQFVLKGLKQNVAAAEGEHQAKLVQNRQLEADIPKFEALKARMSQLQRTIEENQKALPTEAELPAFFETLNRKVIESGVEVNKWRQEREKTIEGFVKVPVTIELTGTFMEIKKFFASLMPHKHAAGAGDDDVQERERIVSIEDLSLKDPKIRNREIVLTANFTATTYRQDEPAGAAAPVKRAITPPPKKKLPPASTPAGARERTERAIDKGDKRDRNAAGVDEAKTPDGSAGRLKGGL